MRQITHPLMLHATGNERRSDPRAQRKRPTTVFVVANIYKVFSIMRRILICEKQVCTKRLGHFDYTGH